MALASHRFLRNVCRMTLTFFPDEANFPPLTVSSDSTPVDIRERKTKRINEKTPPSFTEMPDIQCDLGGPDSAFILRLATNTYYAWKEIKQVLLERTKIDLSEVTMEIPVGGTNYLVMSVVFIPSLAYLHDIRLFIYDSDSTTEEPHDVLFKLNTWDRTPGRPPLHYLRPENEDMLSNIARQIRAVPRPWKGRCTLSGDLKWITRRNGTTVATAKVSKGTVRISFERLLENVASKSTNKGAGSYQLSNPNFPPKKTSESYPSKRRRLNTKTGLFYDHREQF